MAVPLLLLTAVLNAVMIVPLAAHARDVMHLGILEARGSGANAKTHRFCISFSPKVSNLTTDKNSAESHQVVNLTDWNGCPYPVPYPLPALDQRLVFLNQSTETNCSLADRADYLQRLRAYGAVIQANESLRGLIRNASASPVPITFIAWHHVAKIMNMTPPITALQYAIPDEKLFNYGLVIIWIIANFTVIVGALWSATVKYELYMHEQQSGRPGPEEVSGGQTGDGRSETSSTPVTIISSVAAIVLIVSFLLLSYFFPIVMYYVVLVLFFVGSVSGLYTCLNAITARLPCGCDLGLTPPVWCRCCTCRARVSQLLLFAVALTAGIVWIVYRNNDAWGWVLQDLLGVAFSLSLIRSVRLPNLRIMTFFAVGLLIYDIFFVFVTPLLTPDGKSIMVEVATGGGNNILPMVLKVPYIINTPYPECQPADAFSLLGYGDIIVPGFIVAFCAAFDKIHNIPRNVYYATSAIGYGVGLVVTFVALYAMEAAQPALLYLVPLTLLPVMLVALIRREFGLLWHGGKQTGGELISSQPSYSTVVNGDD